MLTSADTEHNTHVNAQQTQFVKECTLKLKILLIYSGVLNTPVNSIFPIRRHLKFRIDDLIKIDPILLHVSVPVCSIFMETGNLQGSFGEQGHCSLDMVHLV